MRNLDSFDDHFLHQVHIGRMLCGLAQSENIPVILVEATNNVLLRR